MALAGSGRPFSQDVRVVAKSIDDLLLLIVGWLRKQKPAKVIATKVSLVLLGSVILIGVLHLFTFVQKDPPRLRCLKAVVFGVLQKLSKQLVKAGRAAFA